MSSYTFFLSFFDSLGWEGGKIQLPLSVYVIWPSNPTMPFCMYVYVYIDRERVCCGKKVKKGKWGAATHGPGMINYLCKAIIGFGER